MNHSEYTILIDGKWSLEDLYIFPHAYEQVYFAFEALSPTGGDEIEERILHAFSAFPWRGGYSAVSFYNQLKLATPIRYRPEIKSIQYASPGYIELLLNPNEAIKIAVAITSVAGSLTAVNKLYHDVYSGLQKRKLLGIQIERKRLRLKKEELEFIRDSSNIIADILKVESIDQIDEWTKEPLISLKILLSVYRRVRTLAKFVDKGKAKFTTEKAKSRSDRRR